MLRGAIICPDPELITNLDEALLVNGRIAIVRALDHYPSAVEMARMLRASAPQIVFLSTEAVAGTAELIGQIDDYAPGVQVIAISRKSDSETLIELMRAGVREFLALPFGRQQVYDAIANCERMLQKRPATFESSDLLVSFLPSKAGVGTSTLAANVAMAMSQIGETRVGLTDLDLSSGMLRFMFKLETDHGVTDAVEHAVDMDEQLWPQLITSLGSLDVLHAGRVNPNLRIEPTQIRRLTEYMRRCYRAICFDLSGNLERYAIEVMQESKRIFLVCTPEIPSLHLAREKYAFLKSLNLEGNISVLLNRVTKRAVITPQHVEQILGMPVLVARQDVRFY
jgi:pilus assembly protein CpaE